MKFDLHQVPTSTNIWVILEDRKVCSCGAIATVRVSGELGTPGRFASFSFCMTCYDRLAEQMRKKGSFPAFAFLRIRQHYGHRDNPVYFQLEAERAKLFFRLANRRATRGPAKK
jgi:hypothetical protein